MTEAERTKWLMELPPETLEKIKEVAASLTNTVRDVGTSYPDFIPLAARCYYRIHSGAFETIVSFLDAKSESEAIRIATEDPLQPWYKVHGLSEIPHVEPITHSQYVDWLRR